MAVKITSDQIEDIDPLVSEGARVGVLVLSCHVFLVLEPFRDVRSDRRCPYALSRVIYARWVSLAETYSICVNDIDLSI